jgi:hypothetical protein
MKADAFLPPDVAVTVAVPVLSAGLTRPVSFTITTFKSLLSQITGLSVTISPAPFITVATSCRLVGIGTMAVAGDTEMDATASADIVSLQEICATANMITVTWISRFGENLVLAGMKARSASM